MWRNRVGSDNIEVKVRDTENNREWTFNSLEFSLRGFDVDDEDVIELGSLIAEVLCSENKFINLQIDAYVKAGEAQDVYPSEELVLDKDSGKFKR